jgi:hypothetical protein
MHPYCLSTFVPFILNMCTIEFIAGFQIFSVFSTGQAVRDCLILEVGTDRLSRAIGQQIPINAA